MNGRSEELIRFCQIMATAIKCGRPLPEALLRMKPLAGNDRAAAWCNDLGRRMGEGYSIEAAVKELSGFDPVLARLMPLLGENRLILVLENYTRYLVVIESLNQRMTAAIAYPFLLLLLLNFNLFHLNFVLFPRAYVQMQSAGQGPSLLMRLLFFADVNFWPLALVIPFLLLVCVVVLARQVWRGFDAGTTVWGSISGMNSIVLQQNTARAQSVICLYLESGYSLEKALAAAADLLGRNDYGLKTSLAALEQGFSIHDSFARSPVLKNVYLPDDSGEGIVEALRRGAGSSYRSSLAKLKNISTVFATLALVLAGFFVLSVTSGFFDTYYWLMWSY